MGAWCAPPVLPHPSLVLPVLLQGYERVADVEGALAAVETRDPWDGGDGQAVEEEEFSLDDIMNEEL